MPVIGYRTGTLPAFFTPDSEFRVDVRLDEPADIARVMKAKWHLDLDGGIVVANPIPAQYAVPHDVVDRAIEQALADAQSQGISGKAVTPFLLARVNALTGGDSLAGNIELVLNNARLVAAVAVAFSVIQDAAQRNSGRRVLPR